MVVWNRDTTLGGLGAPGDLTQQGTLARGSDKRSSAESTFQMTRCTQGATPGTPGGSDRCSVPETYCSRV